MKVKEESETEGREFNGGVIQITEIGMNENGFLKYFAAFRHIRHRKGPVTSCRFCRSSDMPDFNAW